MDKAQRDLKDETKRLLESRERNEEMEGKLQKLLGEFTQVRTKAQDMLVMKDKEIKKLKDALNIKTSENEFAGRNENTSGVDSDSSDEHR